MYVINKDKNYILKGKDNYLKSKKNLNNTIKFAIIKNFKLETETDYIVSQHILEQLKFLKQSYILLTYKNIENKNEFMSFINHCNNLSHTILFQENFINNDLNTKNKNIDIIEPFSSKEYDDFTICNFDPSTIDKFSIGNSPFDDIYLSRSKNFKVKSLTKTKYAINFYNIKK